MNKSNKVIYALAMSSQNTINWEDIKSKYILSKEIDNILNHKDVPHLCSLVFLKEEGDLMFFQLSKWDKTNIRITNLVTKKEIKSYLKKDERVKNYSLFAVYKSKIFLTLYNHFSFGYVYPMLHTYLKLKENIDLDSEYIDEPLSDSDIKKICVNATQIVVKKAQKTYKQYELEDKGNSRKKIKRYNQSKETIYKFQRLTGLPLSEKLALLNPFRDNKHNRITITSKDFGVIENILEEQWTVFPCDIPVDADNCADVDKFSEYVVGLCKTKKSRDLLDSYVLN